MSKLKNIRLRLIEKHKENGFFEVLKSYFSYSVVIAKMHATRWFYRLYIHFYIKFLHVGKKGYSIIDSAEAGYAVRSITQMNSIAGKYIITADVGDDTLSILPVRDGKLKQRFCIQFPRMSAPIGVRFFHAGQNGEISESLLAATFNFDETNTHVSDTYVCESKNIAGLIDLFRKGTKVVNSSTHFTKIIERKGNWGFRSINNYTCHNGRNYIVSVDRSRDLLYIIELLPGCCNIRDGRVHNVDLKYDSYSAEPIFTAIVPPKTPEMAPLFCISQRGKNDITLVQANINGHFEVVNRIDVGGTSRSNVAVGHFRTKRCYDVAIALWGGDPKDLQSKVYGKIAILFSDMIDDINYSFLPPFYLSAGIHPTDVIAGDFDGDGLDELAVLNYGCGLSEMDRTHPGGIQIFKYSQNSFKKVFEVMVPNPRTGISADIDEDGIDELIISLFFEKRLIIIKYNR